LEGTSVDHLAQPRLLWLSSGKPRGSS